MILAMPFKEGVGATHHEGEAQDHESHHKPLWQGFEQDAEQCHRGNLRSIQTDRRQPEEAHYEHDGDHRHRRDQEPVPQRAGAADSVDPLPIILVEDVRCQNGDDEGQGSRESRKVAPLYKLRGPVREALRDGLDASQCQVARDRDRGQQGHDHHDLYHVGEDRGF